MMVHCKQDRLSTTQRVFGMTLMSTPFWLLLSVLLVGCWTSIRRTDFTVFNCGCLFWVVATLLFFRPLIC
ncbi:MAG: multidrug resistance efflux transporter family protein [Streptococcus salivarius]